MAFTTKGMATRQRLLEGASTYLRSTDPGNATLDDIRAATRTSKSQIFHYFPGGKEELFLEVARLEAARVIDDQQPYLGELDSWAAWDRWRRAVLARYKAQGPNCPLAALMNQVGSVPGAAEVSTTLIRQWQDHVRVGIETMQANGSVSAELDARRTSAAIIAGIQGGVSVLQVTGRTDHLEAILALLITHLRESSPA
ncbi:transcriptional regulator, TetR family [Nocardioides sp. YR527]|uniref:TetR/AcrR family transcriptional regulator n=1 Tax=Nocardioides sp. YR527 TaxID=1881028 RepID=UPI000888E11B|nr:TetR family transcriptional regulator [Nocardioides sp. YR527]SDK08768.1 transcriptional regulator, TetR family [Nocardioides sp. YR527]